MAKQLPGEAMRWAKLIPELLVADFSASLDFYCRVLGFKVLYDRPEECFAYPDFHGAQLMIEQTGEPWLTGPMEPPFGRGINLQIEVPDTALLLAGLNAESWPLYKPQHDAWYRAGDIEVGNRQFLM